MIKYRPEIDGLRAIAIIPVLLFHLGYNWISGGYFGVDVFFVISGYLITALLVPQISESQFSMIAFWKKRVKRLFPALLTMALFILVVFPLIIFKPIVKEIATDSIPAIFSYFNIHALINFGSYWGVKAENSYLLHTWSLSVEEQFYLIYPFFLLLTYKYFKRFFFSLLVISLLSFLLYLFFLKMDRGYAHYLFLSRIWELCIGGVISLVNLRFIVKDKYLKSSLIFIGLLFIFFSYFSPEFYPTVHGYGAVFPVIGVALLIGLCNQYDFLGRFLSHKSMIYIGKISYSLYLWHWPIIVLFGSYSFYLSNYNIHFVNLVIVIVSILMAMLSYHLVENKTRNGKHTLKIVAVLIVCIVAISSYYKSALYTVFYNTKYDNVESYTDYYNITPNIAAIDETDVENPYVVVSKRKPEFLNAYKEEGIISKINDKNPRLILLGDSHGVMWAHLINQICDSLKVSSTYYTANGTLPFFNLKNINVQESNTYFTQIEKLEYSKSLVRNIEKWNPEVVLIVCRWEILTDDTKGTFIDLLNYLNSKSIKVLLFTQPPVLEFMVDYNASQYFTYIGMDPVKGYNVCKVINNVTVEKQNVFIKNILHEFNNVEVYDVYSSMLKDGKVIVSNNNEIFYNDDDHLSYQGTVFHKERIVELLTNTLK